MKRYPRFLSAAAVAAGFLTVSASAQTTVYSENYDGLTVGTGDLVIAGNPVFGSAAPDVTVDEWAVGHQTFSVADAGSGDHVLRLSNTNSSFGAAVWLDVSSLVPGDYSLQFTVSGYTLSGTGTAPTQFANVLKAKGVDASSADTVTWDLAKGANFDNTVTGGGATVATNGSYLTSISPRTGSSAFSADGTVTHSFTIAADDEYIGLIIGNNDLNGQTVAFDIDDLSVERLPWPGDFDDLAVGASDLVVDTAPVFGSASPDVATEQWAVGSSDLSVVDSGAGDHVLSLAHSGSSLGAAIWLDVSDLGLTPGDYTMQFAVSGYALSGTGTAPNQFANVVRAQGVDASTADTVIWSLNRGANFNTVTSTGGATVATNGAYGTSASVHTVGGGATFFTADGTVTHSFTIAAGDEYIGLIIANNDQNGQTAAFAINDVSVERAPWVANFDSLAVGTGDLVVNGNPEFGSAAPDVTVDEWAVGHQTFSVADAGAGDHVLRLSNTNSSFAAAIWLDVSDLELAPGEHRMQFTVSGYTLSGTGTVPTQFANVLKAKGVDASSADTVTWDLAKGANFDNTVTGGGATVATNGSYLTSISPRTGSSAFSADGTVTHSFTIAADDEYIGLIIGNNDLNGQTVAFDVDDVTVEAVTLLLEPTITASTLVIAPAGTVDLTITFDPAADTAELTDSLGSLATDLIALDGDADGVVALTGLTPAATLNYTVTTTNTVDTKDVTARVGIFTEPSDNAFTTALLADGPEFFYRFEEPADALFLYDSSGNDHHTTAILGESGLTQGVSEGGIGQGARLDGSVRIQSPATSNWNQDFSLALVVSADDVLSGQGLIAKDRDNVGIGGIQGRSVLGLRTDPNALHTSIGDGVSVADTSGNLLPNDIRCLVHMTYDDSANEVSYYVNGSLWSTESKTVNDDHTGPWNIAGGANQGKTFGHLDGIMDEAALFIKTLTAGEITAHYNAFLAAGDPLMGGNIDIDSFRAGESVTVTYKLSDNATGVTVGGVAQSLTSGLNVATIQPLADGTLELVVSGPGGPYVESFNVSVTQPQMSIAIDSVSPRGSSAFTVTVDNELLEYRLLRNTDLSSGSFAPTGASAQPASADPGDLSFSLQDGSSPADKAFYRIDYVLP